MDRIVRANRRARWARYVELVTGPVVGRYTSAKLPVEYVILRNEGRTYGEAETYPTPLLVHARHQQRRPRPLGRLVRGKLTRRCGRLR
jgi:hypothetical protein